MAKKIKIGLKKINKQDKFRLIDFEEMLPDITKTNMPMLNFLGNAQVQIEGCSGIIEYDNSIVKISVKSGFITFIGSEFRITSFTNGQIIVYGEISSVEFCL